jgi:hypothetical protein
LYAPFEFNADRHGGFASATADPSLMTSRRLKRNCELQLDSFALGAILR